MKIYFERTNGNNLVIITDGETAKIFDAAPSGIYEGVDLYTEDAADQLRARFQELEEAGELNDFNDIYSPDEMPLEDLAEELEAAELVFEKEWGKNVMNKIDRALGEKMMKTGATGTETVTVKINLTEKEKEEFLNDCEKYNSRNYSWEFEENTLIISYQEETERKISDLEKKFGGRVLTEEEFEELELHEEIVEKAMNPLETLVKVTDIY